VRAATRPLWNKVSSAPGATIVARPTCKIIQTWIRTYYVFNLRFSDNIPCKMHSVSHCSVDGSVYPTRLTNLASERSHTTLRSHHNTDVKVMQLDADCDIQCSVCLQRCANTVARQAYSCALCAVR
jgi:hypothetical protein